jgi:hypothetical protein
MPAWTAPVPLLMPDADSFANYNIAQKDQTFYGVLDLSNYPNPATVYFHPGDPNVGNVAFQRGGNPAARIQSPWDPTNGQGGHLILLTLVLHVPPVVIHQDVWAGFMVQKVSPLYMRFCSGFNHGTFTARPAGVDHRAMPPAWETALGAFLQMHLQAPATCTIL